MWEKTPFCRYFFVPLCRISAGFILKDGPKWRNRYYDVAECQCNMDTGTHRQKKTLTVAQGTVSPSFGSPSVEELAGREERHWFPMRVTYSREMSVKAFLDDLGMENFIPMQYEATGDERSGHRKQKPVIRNLIFLHATRAAITELKMTRREMMAVRYMMKPVYDENNNLIGNDVMTVPDKQMEDFIRVASVADDRIFYMENLAFAGKPGQRVKVVEGDFAGVEGVIRRVKKNKCVVVQIEHVAAVAIAFVPSAFLVMLDQ